MPLLWTGTESLQKTHRETPRGGFFRSAPVGWALLTTAPMCRCIGEVVGIYMRYDTAIADSLDLGLGLEYLWSDDKTRPSSGSGKAGCMLQSAA